MSGGSKNHQEHSDISLTLIYKACSSPNSADDFACRKVLHAATSKQIDYTLRKLKSYTQQSQWPARRLVRCLDYLFTHGIKSSASLKDIVKMTSLMVCLKWVLSAALSLDECLQPSTKFICNLLETVAAKLKDSEVAIRLLLSIKNKDVLRKLLAFTHHSDISIRTYSVRALAAQIQYFAKELTMLNAYEQLNISLLNIPSLLETVYGGKPPASTISSQRAELEQTIVTCHLLESLLKCEDSQQLNIRILFAESDAFFQLVHVWGQVCDHENNLIANNAARAKVKNGQLLVYYLTAIVQKCSSVSQKAASHVALDNFWKPYLSMLMQRWVRGTCCTMNAAVITPAALRAERSVMEILLRISLDIVPVLQHHQFWLEYVDQTICNLTNFFMAYISQPITPEQACMVGKASTLLHTNICIDVEERGYMLTADMLRDHQDLLVLLLESFIQHVQLASSVNTILISGRIGWCLKSFLTILLKADQLETSRLRSRLLKLVVFFLHYQDAIDVLATSTTSITPFVWGPTIELAKNGLTTAMSLSPIVGLTAQETSIIYKAKRAFVSLELISRHPRACERLMDCNVLQLVDISFIPSGKIIEKTSSLFGMYALYGRFIASLSRRTAYVRTRLRDECGLFPLIMKLLQQAIEHKETIVDVDEQQSVRSGWNQVILGCLLVVNSFQYDETSTSLWLSWKLSTNKGEEDVKVERDMLIDGTAIPIKVENEDYGSITSPELQIQSKLEPKAESKSILPYVLSVLFPWRGCDIDMGTSLKKGDDRHIIALAAQVLDQLSTVPLCGRQMIMDETALSNLASLMVALTTAEVCKDSTDGTVDQCTFVPAQRKIEELQEDVVMEESILDNLEQRNAEEEMPSNPEVPEDVLNMQCAQHLQRSATRILICHDNIQFTILSDAFTSFFRPTIRHPSHNTSQEYWRREICDNLYKLKLGDFEKLYKFTEASEDHAIKLYEFTAIAVGYSAIGTASIEDWNSALGLTTLEENIVSTRHVFGVFCQMLVYELEYDAEVKNVKEEETEQDGTKTDSILTLITPFRRNAAAQVIEALALEHEVFWKVQTDSIRDMPFIPDCIELDTPAEIVHFKTDDSPSLISGNRQLLRARSPIFEAMLGSHYAEESNLAVSKAIPLHDVTFHSLNLFISVIHQLNDTEADDLDSTIVSWPDIIDLLLISDRFGSKVVKHRCEHWVLDRVRHLNTVDKDERSIYLEGLLRLYRQCRDPIDREGGIESETWPFATVVKESLKAIVQFMSESCQTTEFMKMVKDKNIEELDAFCDGIAYLIKRN